MANLEKAVKDMRELVAHIRQEIGNLEKSKPIGSAATLAIDRLRVAIENSDACWRLAEADLFIPLFTVTRSLFESVIATFWGCTSEENATVLLETPKRELIRLVKNNLEAGRAIVCHHTTGDDKTVEILQSDMFKCAKRPPRFSKMAEQAGIKNIYDALYGIFSAYTHGNEPSLPELEMRNNGQCAALEAANAYTQALLAFAQAQVYEKRSTTKPELEHILDVRLAR